MSEDNSIGIAIGHTGMKEAAEPLAAAIVAIMTADADQETRREALRIFGASVKVENCTISGSTVIGPRTVNINADDTPSSFFGAGKI